MTTARPPRSTASARKGQVPAGRCKRPAARQAAAPEQPAAPAATASAAGPAHEPAGPARGTGRTRPVTPAGPSSGIPPQLARILGAVVAPATFLSALLYYFGWS